MRLRPIVTATLLASLALLVYSLRLGAAPLGSGEVILLQQADRALSSPALFFHVADERWLQPVAVYATAIVRAAGGGELSGRVASAIVGALNVGLIFLAARTFLGTAAAIGAAVLLMVTPAHAAFAQLGTDAIYSTPFVLLWLIAMLRFAEFDRPIMLALASAALGLGAFSHPAAPLTMAWLWIITLISLVAARRATVRRLLSSGGAFGLMFVPAAVWYLRQPSSYPDTFGRWAIFAAHLRFPLDGLRAQINWNTLGTRASIFWGLLDPSFLFFAADDGSAAPMLACVAVLAPLGILWVLSSPSPLLRVVVIAGALVPPLIASTFGQPRDLGMTVPMIALAALLAGAGAQSLRERSVAVKLIAAAALAVSAFQLLPL